MVLYTYDTGDNGIGRLTSVSQGATWSADYTYDARGDVASRTRSFTVPGTGGNITDTRSETYEYNALGAVSNIVYADDANPTNATSVDIGYDEVGRPQELHHGAAPTSASLARNVAGQVIERNSDESTQRKRPTNPIYRPGLAA